jgi:streptogramin lyase
MISWNRRVSFALVAALVLSACSAGGGATPPGAPIPSAEAKHHGKGRLVFRIRIPKHGHHHRLLVRGRDGKPRYISAATEGLTLAITGQTSLNKTVSLLPSAQGCTSSLATTQCTLTIPGLAACPTVANCYTASIKTYDGISGCPSACSVSGARELSANTAIPFHVAVAQANTISATLDGIPHGVRLVPDPYSTLNGSAYAGYTLSKCGTDYIDVLGVDVDGNYILGAGAPVPSLTSDSSALIVATPAPSSPNSFQLTRSYPNVPLPGSTAHLNAVMAPLANSGATPVPIAPVKMTFDATTCGVFTEFDIPTANSSPSGIALGPDGNLWFTELQGGKIGQVTTAGVVTEFSTGLSASPGLTGITKGPDGNMWFAESTTGYVGKITTSGTITEYPISTSNPQGMATGADGNLYVAEYGTSMIGQVATGGMLANEYAATASSGPIGIVAGPDNNLWFTECAGNRIGRVTTGGTVTEFALPPGGSQPTGITVGPDGNLWFTEKGSSKIGVITTAGVITQFPVGASPSNGITTGADGNMYFTSSYPGIVKIATDGSGAEVFGQGLPDNSSPNYITLGADKNLWFTDRITGKIGRLQ